MRSSISDSFRSVYTGKSVFCVRFVGLCYRFIGDIKLRRLHTDPTK